MFILYFTDLKKKTSENKSLQIFKKERKESPNFEKTLNFSKKKDFLTLIKENERKRL